MKAAEIKRAIHILKKVGHGYLYGPDREVSEAFVLAINALRAHLEHRIPVTDREPDEDGWEKHVHYRRSVLCQCGYMAWEYRTTPGRTICTKCGGQDIGPPVQPEAARLRAEAEASVRLDGTTVMAEPEEES